MPMNYGIAPDSGQADIAAKAVIAKTKVEDALRDSASPDYQHNLGWWPRGSTVARVVLLVVVAIIVVGSIVAALNR
jgi:hypothetical protein